MNNASRIYWFSGTGNSLYAAKRLSTELGNIELTQITSEAPTGAVGGKGEKIGFVFPSYYLNLPRAVQAYINKTGYIHLHNRDDGWRRTGQRRRNAQGSERKRAAAELWQEHTYAQKLRDPVQSRRSE